MMRCLALLLVSIALAGCSNDPVRFIPVQDRTMLQAEARLGEGSASAPKGAISVAELMAQARGAGGATGSGATTVLRFDTGAVQPDAAQRETIHQFAQAQPGAASATVASRPGNFDDGVIGQRRAVAVSRELANYIPDVAVQFNPQLPDGVVVLSRGAANQTRTRQDLPQ